MCLYVCVRVNLSSGSHVATCCAVCMCGRGGEGGGGRVGVCVGVCVCGCVRTCVCMGLSLGVGVYVGGGQGTLSVQGEPFTSRPGSASRSICVQGRQRSVVQCVSMLQCVAE